MLNKNTKLTGRDAMLCALPCLLLLIKSYLFYSKVNLGSFDILFTLLTPAIFLELYTVISCFSVKTARCVMFVLYTVISVFMAVDSVYFSYTSRMPSASQLGMAGQLTDISSTILNLIRPRHIFMLVDFPFWCFRAVNTDEDKVRDNLLDRTAKRLTSIEIKKAGAYTVSAVLCVSALLTAVFWKDFRPKYMVNELFCYHTCDFYRTIAEKSSERSVDKSQYTSAGGSDSRYFGIAEGRNLIVIQVEAMQNFVIGATYEGQEITPNLNSLIAQDSFYFDNYYYQIGGGNTADAEFAVNNSLFPPENAAAYVKYTDNRYHGLPYLLKDNGYSGAHAFHNYTGTFWSRDRAYPNQGFDSFTPLEDFEEDDMFPMGLSDKSMFAQSMKQILSYEEPFYTFFVTVSSHHPYAIPLKDRELTLKPEDEGTLFGLYITSMNYADRAIGQFIDSLRENGLYDRSIIAVYGDHYALANTDSENYSKVAAMTDGDYSIFDVFNVPLIINVPNMGFAETKSIAGGHIDFMPTVLCLLGIENDKTVMFGQNLLEAEHGFVCEQTHVAAGSFITDEVYFKKPYNNIKSNYDAYLKSDMSRLNPDDYEETSALAEERIKDCQTLLENDDIFLP